MTWGLESNSKIRRKNSTNTKILVTSIKRRFKSSTDSLKQDHEPPKELIKAMTLQTRRRPKRQTITKKTSSTKRIITFTEVSYKYMQVSMKRRSRIWNKVQVSCIQTKYFTRKTSSQIMRKIWHSLRITLARPVARQTSLMLVSVHWIFMSSPITQWFATSVWNNTKRPLKNLTICSTRSQRSMQVSYGLSGLKLTKSCATQTKQRRTSREPKRMTRKTM